MKYNRYGFNLIVKFELNETLKYGIQLIFYFIL